MSFINFWLQKHTVIQPSVEYELIMCSVLEACLVSSDKYFRILACLYTWHLHSNYPISNHHETILTEMAQLQRWLTPKQCGTNSIFVCLQYNVPYVRARIAWQTYFSSCVKYLNVSKIINILDILMTTRLGDPHIYPKQPYSLPVTAVFTVASLRLPICCVQHLGAKYHLCPPPLTFL